MTSISNNGLRVEMWRCFLWVACVALVALLAGCSGKYGSRVTGSVAYDGQPLDRGTVTFHPATGATAYGRIQPDGGFKLRTGEVRGLAPGEYRVTVQSVERIPGATDDDPPFAKALIPLKYKHPSESGLSYTVSSGRNHFDIDLPRIDE